MFLNRLILTLCFCLIALPSFGAELLIQAKPHWKDEFTQKQVDKMSVNDKRIYEARSQVGDVIAVRPDGWEWGKEEGLPNYIVVKVPDIKYEDAKKYEEPFINEDNPDDVYLKRKRKHRFNKNEVELAKTVSLNAIQVNKAVAESNLSIKDGSADEVIKPSTSPIAYLKYYYSRVSPYINVAYNYWTKNAFAAQFLYKTVKPAGGDYTALETCMNANEQDLTGDGWFDIEISGDWTGSPDTTKVFIHNYTTTSDDYINIYTSGDARHDGTAYKATAYKLSATTSASITGGIDVSDSYVTIDGLVIGVISGNQYHDSCFAIQGVQAGFIVIKNNITYIAGGSFSSGTDNWRGIKISQPLTATFSYYIYNNIVYYFKNDGNFIGINVGMGDNRGTQTIYVYNNTSYDNGIGLDFSMRNSNNLYNENNVCVGNNLDFDFTDADANFIANDYNCSEDATATGANSLTTCSDTDFVSVTASSEDFHLSSDAAVPVDEGDDLGADYVLDIDGDNRDTYTPWDMGADEYVSGVTYCPPTCTGTGISIYGNNSIYGNITIY